MDKHINDITGLDATLLIKSLLDKFGDRYQLNLNHDSLTTTVRDTVSGREIEYSPCDPVKEVYQRIMLADHYG